MQYANKVDMHALRIHLQVMERGHNLPFGRRILKTSCNMSTSKRRKVPCEYWSACSGYDMAML